MNSVGDACVLQIPEQKILDVIKLEKGIEGLVTRGVNAGKVGKIEEVKEGTFILPKRVDIKLEDRRIEIPSNLVMPVGSGKPVIQIR